MNRTAVEWTIKLGLALDCEIAEQAVFSRKNYFYPDCPRAIRSLSTIYRLAQMARCYYQLQRATV